MCCRRYNAAGRRTAVFRRFVAGSVDISRSSRFALHSSCPSLMPDQGHKVHITDRLTKFKVNHSVSLQAAHNYCRAAFRAALLVSVDCPREAVAMAAEAFSPASRTPRQVQAVCALKPAEMWTHSGRRAGAMSACLLVFQLLCMHQRQEKPTTVKQSSMGILRERHFWWIAQWSRRSR